MAALQVAPFPVDAASLRAVRGLYVHVPFCASDCAYCAFSREVPRDRSAIASYLAALDREVDYWLDAAGAPLTPETVYVGGGTPTFLTPEEWSGFSTIVARLISKERLVEVSIEANPETVDAERLTGLSAFGLTRLSIGAQSTHAATLAFLDRRHGWPAVERAILAARSLPGVSVSLDLIYGVPGLTLAAWEETLQRVLDTRPDHVSAYCLSYEEGTSLAKRKARGDLQGLGDDAQRAQYDALACRLPAAGLARYEVSNFGKEAAWSRHNLNYWTRGTFLGIGPSAHSFHSGCRAFNHTKRRAWEDSLAAGSGPVAGFERPGPREITAEALMQLRIAAGVPAAWFPRTARHTWNRLDALSAGGLLAVCDGQVRLEDPGYFVSDGVIAELLLALERDGDDLSP